MKKSTIVIVLIALVFIVCSLCGCEEESHLHTFSLEWTYDANNHWHESTCGHGVVSGTGPHNWSKGNITRNPSCTEEGERSYVCTICGFERTESIPARGHSFSSLWYRDETYHWHSSFCSNCGQSDLFDDRAEHAWNSGIVSTEASCTKAGYITFTCEVCGGTRTEIIPALGHSYDEEITTEASCTTYGVRTFTCSRCGNTYTKSTPPYGHSFSSQWNSDESYHWHVATCEHTDVLGDRARHTWKSDVFTKAATCTEDGSNIYTCEICGFSKTEVIKALGHSFSKGITVTEAGCTTEGLKSFVCSACGVEQTEVIPAKGHSFSTNWSTDETYHWHEAVCVHTDEVSERESHKWDSGIITKQATCLDDGIRTYTCSVCKTKKTEIFPALDHDLIIHNAKSPTCTENGWDTYVSCSRCEYSTFSSALIPALGHDFSNAWTTNTGYHWHSCENDGCSVVSGKAAHSFEVVYNDDKSLRWKECSICGMKKDQESIYSIVLSMNCDGGNQTEVIKVVNSNFDLSLVGFSRTGYDLVGWALSSEGEAYYTQTINNDYFSGKEERVLYAIWKPKTYTVYLDNGGGTRKVIQRKTFGEGSLTLSKGITKEFIGGYGFLTRIKETKTGYEALGTWLDTNKKYYRVISGQNDVLKNNSGYVYFKTDSFISIYAGGDISDGRDIVLQEAQIVYAVEWQGGISTTYLTDAQIRKIMTGPGGHQF